MVGLEQCQKGEGSSLEDLSVRYKILSSYIRWTRARPVQTTDPAAYGNGSKLEISSWSDPGRMDKRRLYGLGDDIFDSEYPSDWRVGSRLHLSIRHIRISIKLFPGNTPT